MAHSLVSCHSGTRRILSTVGIGLALGLSWFLAAPAEAAFPGANGRIAFQSNRAAPPFVFNTDIYTMDADGGNVSRVTTTPCTGCGPGGPGRQSVQAAWSADGQRIAFGSQLNGVTDQFGRASFDIWVVQADGSGLTQLTTSAANDSGPTWSPDGTQIAFDRAGPDGPEVWIMNADGTGQRFLGHGNQPSWSPDGTKIAVGGNGLISTIDASDGTGGGAVSSPPSGARDDAPDWSPDGRKLAFKREGPGSVGSHIYTVNADSTGTTQLTTECCDAGGPAWSPDGEKLVYARSTAAGVDLFTVNADGSGETQISDDHLSANASWQPLPAPARQDTDGDGIEDSVDTDPPTTSDGFDDGNGSSGTITDRAGLDVRVDDLPASAGVRVTVGEGSGSATMKVCAGFTLKVAAGSTIEVTCGSVQVKVVQGSAEVILGGGLTVVAVPQGVTAMVSENADEGFTVQNLGGGDLTVSVDGVNTTIGPGSTKSVTAWDFRGFTAPVNNPDVLNVVNAGRAVPLKWRLVRADGTPVTTLTTAKLTATALLCSLGTTPDLIEEQSAGASGLQNLGDGYYQFNWKTPKGYANSCKALHLDIGEGVSRDAYFKFTK